MFNPEKGQDLLQKKEEVPGPEENKMKEEPKPLESVEEKGEEKEKFETFLTGLPATLDILLGRLELEKEEKENLRKALEEKIGKVGKYDEKTIIESIEEIAGGAKEETRKKILENIIREKEGEKSLNPDWAEELEVILSETAKKGPITINFREKLEQGLTPEEQEKYLKAYLYLLAPQEEIGKLPTEGQKELQGALESLVTQKEEFRKWWTLWLKKGVKTPPFIEELSSHLGDLVEGKEAINLEFEKELFEKLPKEVQENYEKLGIKREGEEYKLGIEKDKLFQIFQRKIEREKELLLKEAELEKLRPEAKELIKKAEKIFKGSPEIKAGISLISKEMEDIIKGVFKKGKEEGITSQELEEGIKILREGTIDPLNEMLKTAEQMPPDWKKKNLKERKNLKKAGETLGIFALFSLASFFLLPAMLCAYWCHLINQEIKKKTSGK